MSELIGSPDIILVWPRDSEAPDVNPVAGYTVRPMRTSEDDLWIDIHRKAVPSFGEPDLRSWLARYRELSLDEGILIAVEDDTGRPVATAGSLANSKDGMFPDGGQLGWVATVPEARGLGLATWLSGLATRRLKSAGFRSIFLCTGDEMLSAIRVYLGLGYVPCMYAADQEERWARICAGAGLPFEPTTWPTVPDYVSS